jgi:hypothetical protein
MKLHLTQGLVDLQGISNLDLPVGELELVVHETCVIHGLDCSVDGLTEGLRDSSEPGREGRQRPTRRPPAIRTSQPR